MVSSVKGNVESKIILTQSIQVIMDTLIQTPQIIGIEEGEETHVRDTESIITKS